MINQGARLNVLMLLPSSQMGGIEKQVLFLAENLPDLGVGVAVCCPPGGPLIQKLANARATVYTVKMKSKFDFGSALQIAALLRAERFDLLHTHQERTLWFGMLGKFLARAKIPVIQTEHNRTIDRIRSPKRVREMRISTLKMHQVLAGHVAGFIAVSKAVKEFLVKYEGLPDKKVEVIPIAIDPSAFTSRSDKRAEMRQNLDLPMDSAVVVNVSKLSPQKDHKTFLEMARLVLQRVPSVYFLAVGEGTQKKSLERLTIDMGISDKVHFLGWVSSVAEVLAAADVFVLSSLWEGLPAAPIEAMAIGLPVVATAVSGTPEIVAHEKTGYLCKPADPVSMASFVTKLLSDPDLRSSMGNAAKQYARENFSPRLFSENTRDFYYHVLSENRAAKPPHA